MAYNFKNTLSWIYPPLCLHCQSLQKSHSALFCSTCLDQLTLIEIKGRCPRCFAEVEGAPCDRCRQRKGVVAKQIAAIENYGPGRTLLSHIQRSDRSAIMAAASLMSYQWLKVQRHLPDQILPIRTHWLQRLVSEAEPALLLATALSKLFSIPFSTRLGERCERVLLVAPFLDDALFRLAASKLLERRPLVVEGLALAV